MKKVLTNIKSAWMALAHRLVRYQTILILTLLYLLVISPMGMIMSLFGWDPLKRRGFKRAKRKNSAPTNWQPVKKQTVDIPSLKRMS